LGSKQRRTVYKIDHSAVMEKPDALSIAAIELQKEECSRSMTARYPHSPIASALPTRNSKDCNFPDARLWAAFGVCDDLGVLVNDYQSAY
jgi:hypothetical protein